MGDAGGDPAGAEQVLQHLSVGVLVVDLDQRVRRSNPAAATLLGLPEDGLAGHRLIDLVRGERHELDEGWDRLVDGAAGVTVDVDGTAFELRALRPEGDFDGAVVSLCPARPRSTALLQEALDSAPLCLVAFDADGIVTYAGGSGFRALGVDAAATVGTDVREQYGRTAATAQAVQRCRAGEQVDTVLPYGGRVWDLHYRPVLGPDGAPAGGLCMAQDVTTWLQRPPAADEAPTTTTAAAATTGLSAASGQDQLQLVAELREALTRDEVTVHYQPVVRVADLATTGLEALVRWEHPTRGLLRPAAFLHLAERTGLLLPLGERVLRAACHAAASWNRGAAAPRPVQVTVNLSQPQLLQPGLVALLREALVVAECLPSWLVLEVDETAVLLDLEAAEPALRGLHQLGVQLALDDVSAGAASATCLRRLPFDVFKVDQSVVTAPGPADREAVAALLALGRRLGTRCTVAGVETPEQLVALREAGCEAAQGHLFSGPLPHEQATSWLQRSADTSVVLGRRPRAAPTEVPASTVARAQALEAEGASLHTIAARLNLEGCTTAAGRRWHHTSVRRLLAEQQSLGSGGPRRAHDAVR